MSIAPDTVPPDAPDRGLRIGDHERAAAAERLSAHAAAGRLGIDELEDRLERVNRAVFAGDLLPLEADLPAAVPTDPHPRLTASARPAHRRRVRRRPPPALIVFVFAAVLASLLVGHPIAPLFVVIALVWRFGGRHLRDRQFFQANLP
ncbi:MAG: hypothetical protein QOH12_706 [Solirubrobacteraceae bacterium]|jgi:hypothetical protein|nr:hypothetical protein [Solirubrobacteraceae bacterium]